VQGGLPAKIGQDRSVGAVRSTGRSGFSM